MHGPSTSPVHTPPSGAVKFYSYELNDMAIGHVVTCVEKNWGWSLTIRRFDYINEAGVPCLGGVEEVVIEDPAEWDWIQPLDLTTIQRAPVMVRTITETWRQHHKGRVFTHNQGERWIAKRTSAKVAEASKKFRLPATVLKPRREDPWNKTEVPAERWACEVWPSLAPVGA